MDLSIKQQANFEHSTEVEFTSTSFISLCALIVPPLYLKPFLSSMFFVLLLPPPPLLFFCFCYLVRAQKIFGFVLYLQLWQKQLLRNPDRLPYLIYQARSLMLIGLMKSNRFLFRTIPYTGARINFKFCLNALINKPLKIQRNLIQEIILIHWPSIQSA